MIIEKLCLGQLQTNCYLLCDPQTKEVVVVDPADEANFIGEKLTRAGLIPKAILATHGHFDHILAAWELQLTFNIPFFIHKDDLFLVKRMRGSASWWLKRKVVQQLPKRISFLREKEKIVLGSQILKVIHTPGHTPGSVCFYNPKEGFVLTGDTLFAQGRGRTDFRYASEKQLFSSLKKLSNLPDNPIIHPGHGPSCPLKEALK